MERPNVIPLDVHIRRQTEFKVLDHGFVRVVDYVGDDAAIVQAARVSYGKGTKRVSEDRGLIRYLMKNQHMSPFEMCAIKLHIKLPIVVARHFIRHRTAKVNEYSARYSVQSNEFYIPELEHIAPQAKRNNQGREEKEPFDRETASQIQEIIRENSERSYQNYEDLLNRGVAREIARMVMPVNVYTEWYWMIDLRNLFHFIKLRDDPHAQFETREYARIISEEIVSQWVPLAHEAFLDYQKNAFLISRQGIEMVQGAIDGGEEEEPPLSTREKREIRNVFSFPSKEKQK